MGFSKVLASFSLVALYGCSAFAAEPVTPEKPSPDDVREIYLQRAKMQALEIEAGLAKILRDALIVSKAAEKGKLTNKTCDKISDPSVKAGLDKLKDDYSVAVGTMTYLNGQTKEVEDKRISDMDKALGELARLNKIISAGCNYKFGA